jgi:hypothetical protein
MNSQTLLLIFAIAAFDGASHGVVAETPAARCQSLRMKEANGGKLTLKEMRYAFE